MKNSHKIPVYSICNLHDTESEDVAVSDLGSYISSHDSLIFPHRHSFYQVLYITSGGGKHLIDFETYDVNRGMIFFLAPGQIHEWIFDKTTDGILINFSQSFFSTFLVNSSYLNNLIFFTGNGRHAMWNATETDFDIESLFLQILSEYKYKNDNYRDIIRALLLQVFSLTQRNMEWPGKKNAPHLYKQLIDFEQLVEQHFAQQRLPKQYAAMLFITPNYLNALCNKFTGRSAGELIRHRILLEAKRLLVNSSLSISEIAWELNFENNSYFSRFFKKYEGVSPEVFKKEKSHTFN